MLKQQFLSNIILLLGLNILIKPLYVFGIEAEVQNIVGSEVYGLYFALFNLCYLFQFFLDFGIQNYTSKYISENRGQYPTYISTTLGSKLILALGFSLFVVIAFFFLGYSVSNLKLLCLVGFQMILISILMFIRANISALGHFRADSIISVIDKLILLILLFYIIYFGSHRQAFNIEIFVYAQLFSSVVTLLIASFYLLNKHGKIKFRYSIDECQKLIKKTYPFALVFLIMTLYTKMDGIMLSRLIDDNNMQAGIYATGYRILDALNMFGFLFASLLLPMFSYIDSVKERNELWEIAYKLLLILVLLATLSGIFFNSEILAWLYTENANANENVFFALMLSFFVMSLSYLFGIMLTAKGSLKRLNMIYLVGAIINWILNLTLIPKYLAVGAAYATLFTQFVVFVGLIYLSYKDLDFQIRPRLLFKSFLLVSISILIFWSIKSYLSAIWVIQVSFSVVLTFLVSFLLGFIRWEKINQLLAIKNGRT